MNLPLNIDIQQILLHMLNFAILFGGLYFILYSPVKKFMDARAEKYKKDDETAKAALKEAEDAKKEYLEKLSETEKEIAQMKSAAEAEIRASAELSRRNAEKEASEIVSAARKRAQTEKEEIISSAKKDITELAATAAEKVVYKDASEAYEGFLDGIDDYE